MKTRPVNKPVMMMVLLLSTQTIHETTRTGDWRFVVLVPWIGFN